MFQESKSFAQGRLLYLQLFRKTKFDINLVIYIFIVFNVTMNNPYEEKIKNTPFLPVISLSGDLDFDIFVKKTYLDNERLFPYIFSLQNFKCLSTTFLNFRRKSFTSVNLGQ